MYILIMYFLDQKTAIFNLTFICYFSTESGYHLLNDTSKFGHVFNQNTDTFKEDTLKCRHLSLVTKISQLYAYILANQILNQDS